MEEVLERYAKLDKKAKVQIESFVSKSSKLVAVKEDCSTEGFKLLVTVWKGREGFYDLLRTFSIRPFQVWNTSVDKVEATAETIFSLLLEHWRG